MAHPNIDQRRKYVKKLLEEGNKFNHKMCVKVGKMFDCSHSAIRADVIILSRYPKSLISPYVSKKLRDEIRKRDGKVCQYCEVKGENISYIVEHIIPASTNGIAQNYNLVIACQSCNVTKGKKVWIPKNLNEITRDHEEWKLKILELRDKKQPNIDCVNLNIEEEIRRLKQEKKIKKIKDDRQEFIKLIEKAYDVFTRNSSILKSNLHKDFKSVVQEIKKI